MTQTLLAPRPAESDAEAVRLDPAYYVHDVLRWRGVEVEVLEINRLTETEQQVLLRVGRRRFRPPVSVLASELEGAVLVDSRSARSAWR